MTVLRNALIPAIFGLLLAACSGQDVSAPDTTEPAAIEAPAPVTPAADTGAADAATAATASMDEDTATTEAGAPAPRSLPPASTDIPGLTVGQDYAVIPGGQPYSVGDGVEVAEVFAYWCNHCAQFDPLASAWAKRLPAGVRFGYVPAVFNPQDNFPRAFFAAEAMGALDKVHAPLFRAIHIERSLRPNASADDIAAFFGKLGVNAQEARSTMDSFAVNASLGRARQFAMRSGVDATPMLIVNGRYRVIGGRTHEAQLQIADRLIAHELAAAAR